MSLKSHLWLADLRPASDGRLPCPRESQVQTRRLRALGPPVTAVTRQLGPVVISHTGGSP